MKGERRTSSGRGGSAHALVTASVALAALVLPACIFGGQTGQNASDDSPSCVAQRSPISDDTFIASLGVTAADAAARFDGTSALTFSWSERQRTLDAELSITYLGDAVERVQDSSCRQELRFAVDVMFRTADGELSELLDGTLIVLSDQRAQLTAEIPVAELARYDAAADGVDGWREPVLRFEAELDAGGRVTGVTVAREAEDAPGELSSKTVATWQAQ